MSHDSKGTTGSGRSRKAVQVIGTVTGRPFVPVPPAFGTKQPKRTATATTAVRKPNGEHR